REPVLTEGLRPKDPPGALKEMLASRSENLMLVSHLPFVERLASLLLTGAEDGLSIDFHPCTTVALQCREEGAWDLLWMIGPGGPLL
ncbi:MAG: phosphohistidine phosphatase SixA, partial [Planctomycetota bacterium]